MILKSAGKNGQPQGILNSLFFSITYLLSAFGYEFLFFLMTVHVYNITKKAVSVGIFAAVTFFPKIFSPLYGVVVDRFDRRGILAVNAGIIGVLAIILQYTHQIVWIYILWFFISIFIMLVMNVRSVLMTMVFLEERRVMGNSLVLSILNLAKLLAPVIAALMIKYWGNSPMFGLTFVIYILCMVFSMLIRTPPKERTEFAHGKDIIFSVKQGIEHIRSNANIRHLAITGGIWRLFLGMQASLFIIYITKYLKMDELSYGTFMAAVSLGSLLGSFAGPLLLKRVKQHILVLFGLVIHYLSFCVLGFLHSFPLALGIVFLSFMIFYATVVGLHSQRDQSTRPDFRGRVYGSITSVMTPPAIISMLAGGALADKFGVETVFIDAGLGGAIVTLLFFYKTFKNGMLLSGKFDMKS